MVILLVVLPYVKASEFDVFIEVCTYVTKKKEYLCFVVSSLLKQHKLVGLYSYYLRENETLMFKRSGVHKIKSG